MVPHRSQPATLPAPTNRSSPTHTADPQHPRCLRTRSSHDQLCHPGSRRTCRSSSASRRTPKEATSRHRGPNPVISNCPAANHRPPSAHGPRPETIWSHAHGKSAVPSPWQTTQTGVPVDSGVEVDVACTEAAILRPINGFGVGAASTMDAPAAAVGDASDLLDVDMHHMPRSGGDDLLGSRLGFAVRVDEAPVVQSEVSE